MTSQPIRILAVLGSLGQRSSNRALLEEAVRQSSPSLQVTLFDALGELPHFDPDTPDEGASPAVQGLRRAVTESDAVLSDEVKK